MSYFLGQNYNEIIEKLRKGEKVSIGFGAIEVDENGNMSIGVQKKKGLSASHRMIMERLTYRDESGALRYYIHVKITDHTGEIIDEFDIK